MRRPLLIAGALKRPPPGELDRVEAWYLSVDRQRDHSQRLAAYPGSFDPRLRGLTGPAGQVAKVVRHRGAAHGRSEQTGSALGHRSGYMVDHSSFTYAVDPQGRLAMSLGHGSPPEGIDGAIRSILVDG